MGFLRIKCDYCGGSWEVYRHQMDADKANQCPHCFKEIDRATWDKDIVPAWGTMEDANLELMKDATGYKRPIFEVSYVGDSIFRNARNARRR